MHSLVMNPIRSYSPRLFSLVASASGSALKKEIDLKTVMMEGSREIAEMSSTDVRKEILTKLLSTTLGVGLSLIISYYGLKWLANTIDPTKQEKVQAQKRATQLLQQIGVPGDVKLTEYELCIAANLVDPLSMVVSWEDIGGLENVIQDIKDTVILPFHKKGLFRESNLIQPPKGVLLYGPPGCGKTMIAKAMAKAAGARFINLQVSSLVDKWYGESQKRAEAVFSLAHKLQPTIIFIDEIDSFLRARGSNDHEATAMVKTQFMSFWDGLMTDKSCRIVIIGASNRPGDIDAAILRRMPTMFNIDLPNQEDRKRILEVILLDEPVADNVDLNWLALQTEGFTGSDLREMCRNAAIANVSKYLRNRTDDCLDEDSLSDVVAWEIMKADFEKALNKMKLTKRVSNLATLQQMSID